MNPRHDVPPEVNGAVGVIERQATAIQVLLAALFVTMAIAIVGWVRDVPPPQQQLSTCLADNARLAKQLSQ
jgi:hypothetical protein